MFFMKTKTRTRQRPVRYLGQGRGRFGKQSLEGRLEAWRLIFSGDLATLDGNACDTLDEPFRNAPEQQRRSRAGGLVRGSGPGARSQTTGRPLSPQSGFAEFFERLGLLFASFFWSRG
jgi:hypothetical protein